MSRRFFLCAIVLPLAVATAWPQESRGTISGRVTDPSGAIIAGASVVVTNPAMGTKIALTTNDAGLYEAVYLIPGAYQIEASARGFRKLVRSAIELRVGDRLTVNLGLEVGAAEQSIT